MFGLAIAITFGIAAIAILLGFIGAIQIFLSDAKGLRDVVVGIVLAALVLLPVGLVAAVTSALPNVNAVTTSIDILSAERRLLRDDGSVRVGGADLAAYPDLLPLEVERPSEDVFQIAEQIVIERGWRVLERTEPTPADPSGRIRAVARTPVLGFLDDIVITISDTEEATRIEILSASRVGEHDLGANARRVGSLLSELEAEAS